MTTSRSYSFICILGKIWMPTMTAAQYKYLTDFDLDNMTDDDGNITRESVDLWLNSNSGDFSSIIDFYADIETGKQNIIINWQDEENKYAYGDCMNEDRFSEAD